MRLHRLRVEQLRQFRQPLEILALEPGLNLFTGPNESGKSTLVRALRAAFFERHRSSAVDDLQPWGDSSAAPAIQLDFDWQGQRWRLAKTFIKHKRCDLQVAGQAFNGDEAEEKLAELMGYQFPGRGASKAEHWGIPGLLWIEQGSGQDIHAAVTHAGDHLKTALGASLGEVAGSVGDDIVARVERERAVLLTGGGRPTGEYAQALQQHTEGQARLDALDAGIATYRLQVDRLGELRRQQRDEDASRPWEGYRNQARQAEARLAEVDGWMQAQHRDEKELQTSRSSQQLCRDQLQAYARQHEALAQRERSREKAQAARLDLQARQQQVDSQRQQAQSIYDAARAALRQARLAEQRAGLDRELARLAQELTEIRGNHARAVGLQARIQSQREQLQAAHVDPKRLKRLQQLSRELSDLAIAQQTAATRVQFELLPGCSLQLGAETLAGQGERLLLAPADLHMAGIGQLRIQPGGEDIAELARRQQTLLDGQAALHGELRVSSLAQAEARAEQGRTLHEDIARVELLLHSLAPHGVEALAGRLRLGEQRQQVVQDELASLPPPESTVPGADPDVGSAEHRHESAAENLKSAERQAADFRRELSLADQALNSAQAEWQQLQDEIQSTDRQQRERQLNSQLTDLRAADIALQATIDLRQRQIDAAQPELLRQDVERYTRSADALEQAAQARDRELTRLQSSLEALGAQGLEEQRAEQAQALDFLARRRDELTGRAQALDLLLQSLRSKRQALTRRLQAPLQRHLNRYLQLLFPQASVSVDDNLVPQTLLRIGQGQEERGDFNALSFGAREQMGLISRLAYADLLQEAGRPTLIILDDALVHSDAQRIGQMKRILFDAAQRHQILLFTCHPLNWRDLGVPARELQALKAGSRNEPLQGI